MMSQKKIIMLRTKMIPQTQNTYRMELLDFTHSSYEARISAVIHESSRTSFEKGLSLLLYRASYFDCSAASGSGSLPSYFTATFSRFHFRLGDFQPLGTPNLNSCSLFSFAASRADWVGEVLGALWRAHLSLPVCLCRLSAHKCQDMPSNHPESVHRLLL